MHRIDFDYKPYNSNDMKIEETKAYKKLGKVAKLMVDKGSSKRTIKDSVTIAKTIGFDTWSKMTDLPMRWHGIVKELTV